LFAARALDTTARKTETGMAKTRRSAPKQVKKTVRKADRLRILVVEARYYDAIAEQLLNGAMAALGEANAEVDRVSVPGALEIPTAIAIAVDAAARNKRPYDGVVALGCVIQGQTFHFDVVAVQSARALIDLSVAHRLPAGNGILTVDNEAQAMARANVTEGNKGGEAAKAALALIAVKRSLGQR
jgi:6,7-dimethyl-8-ribityllumazine synthase